MASNARFHNKYHRRNHHTLPSAGYPDSGADPIASPQEPFRGDFHVIGALSATGNLTIGGNTLIRGNLSALGDFSVVDTIVTVTSALSVINNGTGPAFTVQQNGTQPIAVFLDDNVAAFQLKNGLRAEFFSSQATNSYALAEGTGTTASGVASHAEGSGTLASGDYSHAENTESVASGYGSHAEGGATLASQIYSHAEGYYTSATGFYAHAEGESNIASGNASHAEGNSNVASGLHSHVEGSYNIASGNYSHAEGTNNTASGTRSHAEGTFNIASGSRAHAEGSRTGAVGNYSHTQGYSVSALGAYGHAEGIFTVARGENSHAAGGYAEAAYDRTWIWKGDTNTDTVSTTRTDQFLVSAAGGIFFPGNVGIGTDSVANALTVQGNISASGNLFFYSSTGRNLDLIHSPANDGTNPSLRIGESTPGSTTLSGFSGAFASYDEITNVFGISSVFAPAMGIPAMSIDRNGNVGMGTTTPNEKLTVFGNISASGTITAGNVTNTSYYLAIGPFCSAGIMGSGALQSQVGTASVYPRALSGVMPANELSSRLKNGQGTIEGNFLFEKSENTNLAQWYIEIAKNEVFTNTLSAVYLRTAGDNTRSIFRPVIGTNIGNNYIVMPAYNSTTPYGGSGSNTINYPYAPGDTLYWRVGFNNSGTVGTSIGMALCAGYVRIVP